MKIVKKHKYKLGVAVIILLWFYVCIPARLFNKPTSFVLNDENGNLLGALIAADGQWRFPASEAVPDKFKACITTFEDKRFNYHFGVDVFAMARAVYQNIAHKKVVSGGSTLTMQVIRLSRGQQRNVFQKMIEALLAIRLEAGYSKREILTLYAANAPFGGNVVGLDAAAWRYYGRSANKLSWGEMAALSILPNAPSLVRPGKNNTVLLNKRNTLLDKLQANNTIDKATCALAKLEPLPGKPVALPALTPHLLNRFKKEFTTAPATFTSTKITTTINSVMQQNVNLLLQRYQHGFKGNGINNVAAMVVEVASGNIIAYAGNVYQPGDGELESYVDVLTSARSPGSTLKPLLYAAMQSDGLLLPQQLVADIPTAIGGYTPQNYNLEYDGAVPASRALSRSLNIPAVKMLQQYKYPRFYNLLKQVGFTTITKAADHYGLSMILGGCEVTPFELAGVYSSMARAYLHQTKNNGVMNKSDWFMPTYNSSTKPQQNTAPATGALPLDYTALWHTLNAMQEVMRPGEEGLWNMFNSAQRIAWKTGTSFGYRDGWAIGLTPKYCVVVWVGNTDGEGRPELTGINTAAPVMFDVFRMLPTSPWFQAPSYNFAHLAVCHQTGFKAAAECVEVDTMLVSVKGLQAPQCPYHHTIHLDATGTYRVTENCQPASAMVHKSWFVLPPAMEYYYRQRHSSYQALPAYLPGCAAATAGQMELLYPEPNSKIYVPVELAGEKGRIIFSAAHRGNGKKIFWHLDDAFVGTTTRFHQLALNPPRGLHTITLVDEYGERLTRRFEVQDKN